MHRAAKPKTLSIITYRCRLLPTVILPKSLSCPARSDSAHFRVSCLKASSGRNTPSMVILSRPISFGIRTCRRRNCSRNSSGKGSSTLLSASACCCHSKERWYMRLAKWTTSSGKKNDASSNVYCKSLRAHGLVRRSRRWFEHSFGYGQGVGRSIPIRWSCHAHSPVEFLTDIT